MNDDVWGFIAQLLVWCFAAFGFIMAVIFAVRFVRHVLDTARKLNETLGEAVGFIREHRTDLAAMRQFNAALNEQSPNFGPQPETETQQGYQKPPTPVTFPEPLYERFQTREQVEARMKSYMQEPDAPTEPVDFTPTEQEIVDEERAAELERQGFGRPDPEFKPQAVEVDSE